MRKPCSVAMFVIAMITIASSARAQTPRPRRHHILDSIPTTVYPSIFYPRNPASGDIITSLGVYLTIAPRQIVRDEIRQIPQLDFAMRFGLPEHFGVGLRVAGNYIANQLSLVPSWSYSTGLFSFSVRNTASFWIGAADFTGFSTFAMGFSNAPGVSTGMHVDDFLLSASLEAITNYWHYTKFGSDVVHRQIAEFEGEAVTLAVKQDAFGGHRINWGIRFDYTTPGYQLWLAFSDTRQRILTPSFFFGMIL